MPAPLCSASMLVSFYSPWIQNSSLISISTSMPDTLSTLGARGWDQNSVSDSAVILYRRWGSDRQGVMASDLLLWPGGGCIRPRLPIGIVLDQSDSVHLIFHSNFIKSQDWAERRPAAPSGASQNWNLKLTRFIEMETSNIKELSLNFIDKLRLFWSVSKVSVLLRAFAEQIGISFDCTKRKFQGLKWKYCKWKWHQSSRHSAHSLWKQAWLEFKSCD